MAITALNFKSRRAGKQPRANIFVRLDRAIRRKRVAYAKTGAAHALLVAQREIDNFTKLAAKYRVPIDEMAALPRLPALPGQDWIEHRQAMDDLKPPVKAEPVQAGVPA